MGLFFNVLDFEILCIYYSGLYSIRYQNFCLEIWIEVLFEFLKSDYSSKSYEHLKIIHLLPHTFFQIIKPILYCGMTICENSHMLFK